MGKKQADTLGWRITKNVVCELLARGKRFETGAPVTKYSRAKHSEDLSVDLLEHFNSQFSLNNTQSNKFKRFLLQHAGYEINCF
jgi:hypothetical protein